MLELVTFNKHLWNVNQSGYCWAICNRGKKIRNITFLLSLEKSGEARVLKNLSGHLGSLMALAGFSSSGCPVCIPGRRKEEESGICLLLKESARKSQEVFPLTF